MSDDSLAISTAILAVPYAVCQPASLPRTAAPSQDISCVSWNVEPIPIGRAIAVDDAARALESPWGRDVSLCTSSERDVRVEIEISAGGLDLGRDMVRVGEETNSTTRLAIT